MKQVKLLLTETVDNLGIVGDVVKVRPGYARNFLLPFGLATEPTEGAIKRLSARRAEVESQLKLKRVEQEAMIEKLKGHELTIQRSANEQGILFGGVSQHDIAQALRTEGFAVDDRHVRVGQQIKRLDTYEIPVVIASDLRTEIKLWVVSDKPMVEGEEEEIEVEPEPEPVAEEAAAPAADDAEKPAKGKKGKGKGKGKKDKAENADEAEKA